MGAVHQLDLTDMWHVIDGEQPIDRDSRGRFFKGLAYRPGLGRFMEFEIAGRQRPEADARLDCAAAQQNALVPAAHRSDDDFGIFVSDEAAIGADEPLAIFARGNFSNSRTARVGHVIRELDDEIDETAAPDCIRRRPDPLRGRCVRHRHVLTQRRTGLRRTHCLDHQ